MRSFLIIMSIVVSVLAAGCALEEVHEHGEACVGLKYTIDDKGTKTDAAIAYDKYYFENDVCPKSYSCVGGGSDDAYCILCSNDKLFKDGACVGKDDGLHVVEEDINNCGTKGNVCSPKHSTPICIDGMCQHGDCDEGFADCNGNAADGCEADLKKSDNCGACGVQCGYTCNDGGDCSSKCENAGCCAIGDLHKSVKKGEIKCCSGYKLYKYNYSTWEACWHTDHYGCYTESEYKDLDDKHCWEKK